MNIEATKLELMQMLLQTQQEKVLIKLKKVFEEENIDWWNEISPEERQEIKTGIRQADDKELVPHNKVMNKFKKWH